MKRGLLGGALAAIILVVAAPASAAPPAGTSRTCPPPFTAYTETKLVELAESVTVPEAVARARFATTNRNGDDRICVRDLPGDAPESFAFIDNQAIGRR